MKKFIYLFLLLLAACAAPTPIYPTVPQGATVLILGDSLSYGTGAKDGEDYPTLLAKDTGWNIINEGIPGDTTAGGLSRLPDLLEEHQPKLLIVELGGNDLLRNVPEKEIVDNLKTILLQAKTQGVTAVLVAIPAVSALKAAVGNLGDHPLYENIAKETNTPLIQDVFAQVLSDRDLKADQIHPNARGYVEVSKHMLLELQALGFAK